MPMMMKMMMNVSVSLLYRATGWMPKERSQKSRGPSRHSAHMDHMPYSYMAQLMDIILTFTWPIWLDQNLEPLALKFNEINTLQFPFSLHGQLTCPSNLNRVVCLTHLDDTSPVMMRSLHVAFEVRNRKILTIKVKHNHIVLRVWRLINQPSYLTHVSMSTQA